MSEVNKKEKEIKRKFREKRKRKRETKKEDKKYGTYIRYVM